MKKFSLMLGALGGGFAGYLFSNRKLRDELVKAKDAKAAAKVLGKYLSSDGEKLAKDVKDVLESDTVQKGIDSAKKYASDQYTRAKSEIERLTGLNAKDMSSPSKAKKRIKQKVRAIKKA